jgi:hypothetical protein
LLRASDVTHPLMPLLRAVQVTPSVENQTLAQAPPTANSPCGAPRSDANAAGLEAATSVQFAP